MVVFKVWGTFLGISIIRILILGCLYWGALLGETTHSCLLRL